MPRRDIVGPSSLSVGVAVYVVDRNGADKMNPTTVIPTTHAVSFPNKIQISGSSIGYLVDRIGAGRPMLTITVISRRVGFRYRPNIRLKAVDGRLSLRGSAARSLDRTSGSRDSQLSKGHRGE